MTLRVHEVKCWPKFYDHIESGEKTFEVRKNDRDYKIGDLLVIREWVEPENEHPTLAKGPRYTGKMLSSVITYILTSKDFQGIKKGYAVLGLGRTYDHNHKLYVSPV